VNVAEVAPAATVIPEGAVRVELLESATGAPPAGAPPESVTVHEPADPDVRLAGEQDRDDSDRTGATVIAADLDVVPSVAVTVTV
jgi:hypothetical protein